MGAKNRFDLLTRFRFKISDQLFHIVTPAIRRNRGWKPHPCTGIPVVPGQQEPVFLQIKDYASGGMPRHMDDLHLKISQILSFLRKHRLAETDLPPGVASGDVETLSKLSATIKDWMEAKTPKEIKKTLTGIFSGQAKAKKTDSKIEAVFQPDNFDLIAWEYVSR